MRLSITAIVTRVTLSILGLSVALVTVEVLLLLLVGTPNGKLRVCDPCSYVYDLTPSKGDTNAAGFRGPELRSAPNFRIAILGDSVTYGAEVSEEKTFARQLERTVGAEVINAGVVGYTTFNEMHFLRDRVLPLKPNLIILQTCMNDVVDPELHWNRWSRTKRKVPQAAFPNPLMWTDEASKAAAKREIWFARSQLVTMFRLMLLRFQLLDSHAERPIERNGKRWPTFTTYESNSDLFPLTDYESPEWRWLRIQLDEVRRLAGSTPVVLMIVPLAYELTPGYPLEPEVQFLRYCAESGISCLNLREKFQGHAPEDLYAMVLPGSYPNLPDVWHFNEAGHTLAAKELASFLREKRLMP